MASLCQAALRPRARRGREAMGEKGKRAAEKGVRRFFAAEKISEIRQDPECFPRRAVI